MRMDLLQTKKVQYGNEQGQDRADLLPHIGVKGRYEGCQAVPQEEQNQTPNGKQLRKHHFTLSFDDMDFDCPRGQFYLS